MSPPMGKEGYCREQVVDQCATGVHPLCTRSRSLRVLWGISSCAAATSQVITPRPDVDPEGAADRDAANQVVWPVGQDHYPNGRCSLDRVVVVVQELF